MTGDLQIEQVKKGMDIWFFAHPKDSVPTLQTKVVGYGEDRRGNVVVEAKGIGEAYPLYHFKLPRVQPESFSSNVPLQEYDDLYKRLGI